MRRKLGRSSGATLSEIFARSSSGKVENFFAYLLRGAIEQGDLTAGISLGEIVGDFFVAGFPGGCADDISFE